MSIRFCDLCGNMLTPSLKDDKKLVFNCENCNNEFKIKKNTESNNLVYRNEIRNEQTSANIDKYIINDPTYARSFNLICKNCGYKESICLQNPNINDPGMKLIYLCCNKNYNGTGKPCYYQWCKIGITFVIIPKNWDFQNKEKKLKEINVFGFDVDTISYMIKIFYEKLKKINDKFLPIIKFEYDKKVLDPKDENIWKNIYKKDCKVFTYSKNEAKNDEDFWFMEKGTHN